MLTKNEHKIPYAPYTPYPLGVLRKDENLN